MAKLNFDNMFSRQERSKEFASNVGSPEKPIYEYRFINGVKELVDTGEKTNVYELIQSHVAETDINNIVNRFLNGDVNALNKRQGSYGDFTKFPKTYAELYSRLQECENVFNDLPKELRAKFNNSAAAFWSDFGTDRFVSILDEFNTSTAKILNQVEKEGVENAE